jgi:hypothetical protein
MVQRRDARADDAGTVADGFADEPIAPIDEER